MEEMGKEVNEGGIPISQDPTLMKAYVRIK